MLLISRFRVGSFPFHSISLLSLGILSVKQQGEGYYIAAVVHSLLSRAVVFLDG